MDKSEGKDWLARTLSNFTEETAKIYQISKLKIEIDGLNKTKNEKINILGDRLLKLLEEGKIDAAYFEPWYSAIKDIDNKKAKLEKEINIIKNDSKIMSNTKQTKTTEK